MASWVKVYVDMPQHPKLFGQSVLARHLWTCLICHAKKHHDLDGTIRGQTPATIASLFNLGPARGVKAALDYFVAAGMVTLGPAGEITLTDYVMRQSRMDSLEAQRKRQAEYRKRKSTPQTAPADHPHTLNGDAVGDGDRDADSDGRDAITNVTVTALRGDVRHADSDSDTDLDHEGSVVTKPREESPPWPDYLIPKLLAAFSISEIEVAQNKPRYLEFKTEMARMRRHPLAERVAAFALFTGRHGHEPGAKPPSYLRGMLEGGAGREKAAPARAPAQSSDGGSRRVPSAAETDTMLANQPRRKPGVKVPWAAKAGDGK